MLEHGASDSVHAAKENNVWFLTFDGGQDRHEISGFVGRELMAHQITACRFHSFFKLFSHTLAISRAIVDHGDGFAFEVLHRIAAQGTAQMDIICHHTEGCFIALTCVFGVGGRGGDLWNASVAVDFGSGNGGARVQVPNHTADFGVHQFLSRRCALLGVGGIVLCHQFKFDLFTANGHALGVEFFHGEASTVFVVLAQVGDRTTDGSDMANLDHLLLRHGRCADAAQGCQSCHSRQFERKMHEKLLGQRKKG